MIRATDMRTWSLEKLRLAQILARGRSKWYHEITAELNRRRVNPR